MSAHDPQRFEENLRLLSIFHYIWAALGVFGLGFLAMYYAILSSMMDPEVLAREDNPPPPEMLHFMGMFKWFFVAFVIYAIAKMVLNFLAATWIRARRNWTFCMVVAGLNCISIPLGTILGVFTLVLLTRDRAREAFR